MVGLYTYGLSHRNLLKFRRLTLRYRLTYEPGFAVAPTLKSLTLRDRRTDKNDSAVAPTLRSLILRVSHVLLSLTCAPPPYDELIFELSLAN